MFPFLHIGHNFVHSPNKILSTLFFFTTHFQNFHFPWKIFVDVETCGWGPIVLNQFRVLYLPMDGMDQGLRWIFLLSLVRILVLF